MRYTAVFLLCFAGSLLAHQQSSHVQSLIDEGTRAYRSNHNKEAVEAFQKAVDEDPSSVTAHLMLATAYSIQYVPGSESDESQQSLARATAEYERVLQLDPVNKTALSMLANLDFTQLGGLDDSPEKRQKLDEAGELARRLSEVDPNDKEGFYLEGLIAWGKWYPAYARARITLGMAGGQRGPFSDPATREKLLSDYGTILEDGVEALKRAVEIDPDYGDAMSYLNLLIRERADLRNTQDEYEREIAEADHWVRAAFDARRRQAGSGAAGSPTAAPLVPPPPPPPSPPHVPAPFTAVRIGAGVAEANVIRRVEPIYPELAKAARVQGSVEFTAEIGKDGAVVSLQLVRGHPLLVSAAKDAVMQWRYRPTLLNGKPVEVTTEIVVNFSLSE